MRRHIPQAGYVLIGGLFFLVLSFAPHAAEIEQVEDLYVHTVAGTVDVAGGFLKGGKNFDGGDAAFLMKWDDTDPGFSGHVQSWLDCRRNGGEHDGSFSVHQMVTAWDETTDFGTSIPLAGVDYSPNPIASVGFNNGDGVPSPYEDLADLSALVNYWIANAGKNHGLIFVPRGQLNSSYTGTFGNEIMLPAHERVAGLDSDDTRISTFSTGAGPVTGILEAIDDTAISECCKDSISGKLTGNIRGGVEGGQLKIPLYRFGLGRLKMTSPLSNWNVTRATFELHTVEAGKPATSFNAYRMRVNWDEATATWNQFGASGPQPGIHYEGSSLGLLSVGGGVADDSLDLTSLADFWIDNPDQNFGIILIPVVQSGTVDLALSTSERVAGLDSDDTRLIVTAEVDVTAPALNPVTVSDALILEFLSAPGIHHQLEFVPDPALLNWTASGAPVTGTGGLMQLVDTNGTTAAKFYRLQIQ